MSLTNDQLLDRIVILEVAMNTLQTTLNSLVSKTQMKALTNIRQAEIEDLQERVATLESQVTLLQSS